MTIKRSVIIITYGRTGSTLLVGLLNTARRTLIRGENGNVFYHLFKSYRALVKTRPRGGLKPNHPFFGLHRANVDAYLAVCWQAVLTVLTPPKNWLTGPTTIGFKEIRYLSMSEKEISEYVGFMEKVFPNPVFVFLTRNHKEVMSSGFFVKITDKEKTLKQLRSCNRSFSKIAKNKDNTFSIDYKDLRAGSDKLKDLFAFAGLDYDPVKIEKIMQVDHSPQTPDHLKKPRKLGEMKPASDSGPAPE